jgi:hypothetical protein
MFDLVKIGNQIINNFEGFYSEANTIFDKYHSIQFHVNGSSMPHLIRLRYNTLNKPYILVKQDSSVFRELNVGDILEMEYNHSDSFGKGKLFKTLITSKILHDRYIGHSMVELSIIDN